MCNPTAQDYFSSERRDDPGIRDSDRLLRHLCVPVQIRQVEQTGALRISDQAFTHRKSDCGVSVDLECLLHHAGLTEEQRRGVMPNSFAMIAVTASNARNFSEGVAWTPKPHEPNLSGYSAQDNEFHGEIITPISRSEGRKLATTAQLIWTKGELDLGPYNGQLPDIG